MNEPQAEAELTALRQSVAKGRPAGENAWRKRMIQRLDLHSSQRERGPRKRENEAK